MPKSKLNSKSSPKKDKSLVDVNFTRDINVRLDKKDYVGTEFKLPKDEADRLREHGCELYGPAKLA